LQKVPLFSDLTVDDLDAICQQTEDMKLMPGEMLFLEGSLGQQAFVIQEGQIEIFKSSNGKDVQLAIRQPGDVIGEMAILEAGPRNASGRALTECLLIVINSDQLKNLLNAHPGAALTMLHTVTSRLRNTELLLRQSEKMAQLGTFTAGIAHELNNPSAAIQRATGQLKAALESYQAAGNQLLALHLSVEQIDFIRTFAGPIQPAAQARIGDDPLGRADREAEIEDWLEGQSVQGAWNLAPGLARSGFDLDKLKTIASRMPPGSLEFVLSWLSAGANISNLLYEIGMSAGRMSEIIKALKTYTYLDQAPVQQVDIHTGLEDTLVILRHKLKEGIEIQRQFDPALPRIQAYGSELNQVWTNLIDNAIDAMEGKGRIILRTFTEGDSVVVEVEDNGPGIPDEVQARLFSPFFTTKPVGKGTGLGLNISYNIVHKHGGEIKVFSQPGQTRFQVWLPVNFNPIQKVLSPKAAA
ncbi:MAG TPA: ATP-binding protein, partial [Anaerolineaceae bacterium]|nr:ATP-binding protein [Anaerolineaceae bacterium]